MAGARSEPLRPHDPATLGDYEIVGRLEGAIDAEAAAEPAWTAGVSADLVHGGQDRRQPLLAFDGLDRQPRAKDRGRGAGPVFGGPAAPSAGHPVVPHEVGAIVGAPVAVGRQRTEKLPSEALATVPTSVHSPSSKRCWTATGRPASSGATAPLSVIVWRTTAPGGGSSAG